MIVPKIGRKAAVTLGKAAGVLILAAVGSTVTWLLERGRRSLLEDAEQEEGELVIELPQEVGPENPQQPEGTPEEAPEETREEAREEAREGSDEA